MRELNIYPSQVKPGDIYYVTDRTRPGALGYGRRYPVTVVSEAVSTTRAVFTGKRQVNIRVTGGVPVFHHGERVETFYRGKRIKVYRTDDQLG